MGNQGAGPLGYSQGYTTLSFLTRELVLTEGVCFRTQRWRVYALFSTLPSPAPRVHLHSSWGGVWLTRKGLLGDQSCCPRAMVLSLYLESSAQWNKRSIHRNLGVEVLLRSSEKTPFLRSVMGLPGRISLGPSFIFQLRALARQSTDHSSSWVTEGCYLFRSWDCPSSCLSKGFQKLSHRETVADYRFQWLTNVSSLQ